MPSTFHTRIPELMMASGPCSVYPQVLRAMGQQMVHHRTDNFVELLLSISGDLSELFHTKNRVLPVEGESILGLEMAAYNLVRPGDVCINLATGYYGSGYQKVLRGWGGDVVNVETPYNTSFTIGQVRELLDAHPDAKVLAFVHSETPSASENPLREICEECHRRGVLTIVDSVSGVGGSPLEFDDWGCDVVVTGTQKCLGASPGLSLVALSDRAWQRIDENDWRYDRSYLSFKPWRGWLERDYVPYTPSISLLYGLKAALDIMDDEGRQNVIDRHMRSARACRAGIRGMGLDLWVDRDENMANSVTAVTVPEGIDDTVLRGMLDDEYGLHISGGLGQEAGRLMRIGHMGYTATLEKVLTALSCLGSALTRMGHPVDMTQGLAAASEAYAAPLSE